MKKNRATKRALISSMVTMILCVAMLIGTTFAWFTDTASTGVNKIQAGKLDVELVDEKENPLGESLQWVKAAGAENEAVLWEPGATYQLQGFKVKNNGNLALKYKIVVSGVQEGDAELLKVLDFTMKEGETSLDLNAEHKLAAGETSGLITLTAKMQESAGNEYQNKSVEGITITVVATQDTVESDSKDNQYDKDATYPVVSAEELKSALETAGGNLTVGADIPVTLVADTTVSTLVPQMTITKDTTLDLNGKTIGVDADAAKADYGEASPLLMAVTGGTLTINGDGEINCEAGNNQVYGVNVNGGKVVVNGGKFYGAITAIQVQKGSLEINGGFFDMAPTCKAQVPQYAKYVVNAIDFAYKDGSATITIKGGTFVNFDPSADPEGAGTSYVADGYKVVAQKQANGDTWYTVVAK